MPQGQARPDALTDGYMDIEQDIREHVLSALPYDLALRPELEAKPPAELLVIYLNWCNRLVPAQPRTVHRSAALIQNPLATTLKADLDQLISEMEQGDDLTSHLSRRVKIGYERGTSGNFNQRRDLDLMLADWQVHHLHISSAIDPDGFVKRDGPLLFAAFRPDSVYLIDIFPHTAWTREAITNILIDEWPNSGFVREVKGVLSVTNTPSETERGALRGAGISAPCIERNGKVYMVGAGGITSAGTAARATMRANHIFKAARNFQQHVTAHPKYIADALKPYGIDAPSEPDFHLYLTNDGVHGIIERKTRALFPVD